MLITQKFQNIVKRVMCIFNTLLKEDFSLWLNKKTIKILIIFILLFPALYCGSKVRYEMYKKSLTEEPGADFIGYVQLAEQENYHYFCGWREPLWPAMIRLAGLFTNKDYIQAQRSLYFLGACLGLLALFIFGWQVLGLFEGIFATYLLAFSPGALGLFSFHAHRSAWYLLLMLMLWYTLLRKKWWPFCLALGVATHFRIITLFIMVFSAVLLIIVGHIAIHLPKKWDWKVVKFLAPFMVALAIIAPLLLYLWIQFGDPFYPSRLVLYDAYHIETEGSWFVNVTERHSLYHRYEIPSDFSIWQIFPSVGLAVKRLSLGIYKIFWLFPVRYYLPAFIFAFFYIAGCFLALFHNRARNLFILLVAFCLPFTTVGWLSQLSFRYFLVSSVLVFLLISYALRSICQFIVHYIESEGEDIY